MVLNDVVAELVEEDVSSMIFVNCVEYGLRIRHIHTLLLQQGDCLYELVP